MPLEGPLGSMTVSATITAETEDAVKEVCARIRHGELRGTKRVRLSGNLRTFPRELLELQDSLEILDLSQNRLDSLPPDFGAFQRLRVFFASDNQFVQFPREIAKCALLSMIGFKSNFISSVGWTHFIQQALVA